MKREYVARTTRERGDEGEACAARYLQERGFRILERNFRIRRGEVDIIAVRDDILAFCEVKSWRTLPVESLEYALSCEKRRRIITTAAVYRQKNPEYESYHVRFDVLHIATASENPIVTHLESAFDGES
ncbi:MAG TPA: YraN family protein [Spirochaetia bacterium]|nr:YraN family protein [Spirochaetia bacterium]